MKYEVSAEAVKTEGTMRLSEAHRAFCRLVAYTQFLRCSQALCLKIRVYYTSLKTALLKEIAERYGFELEEMGTDGDHIHVFVGAAPKYAPSKVMQILKSISARDMFKHFPEIRKQLWGGEFRSDGGYLETVGDGVTSEIVKKYVREQGSREEKGSEQQIKLFQL